MLEYLHLNLRENRSVRGPLSDTLNEFAAKGWRVISFSILKKEWHPTPDNHGHGGWYEIEASALLERDVDSKEAVTEEMEQRRGNLG